MNSGSHPGEASPGARGAREAQPPGRWDGLQSGHVIIELREGGPLGYQKLPELKEPRQSSESPIKCHILGTGRGQHGQGVGWEQGRGRRGRFLFGPGTGGRMNTGDAELASWRLQ